MVQRSTLIVFAIAASTAIVGVNRAYPQTPTLPAASTSDPGSFRSTLGPIPGAGGNPFGGTPGTDSTFLGGRAGPSFPRVPSSISTPGGMMAAPSRAIITPTRLRITEAPLFGPLEVPSAAEEEGPADGLTLDQAIDRLVLENLPLQALRWQIPAARADVLTASLRANPILFADSQLVPYGKSTKARPEGPNQYDLNINHPVDYSGKRLARTESARQVLSLQEARYQDAVRIQIDNLYTVYIDVLAARETARFAAASQTGLQKLLAINETLFQKSNLTRADVGRVKALVDAAKLGRLDAVELTHRTKRSLGLLLNLPPSQAENLEIRGKLGDTAPPPPPLNQLVQIASDSRADLAAARLGAKRAAADVQLALANRFGDAYVLYQPYTFQDNAPLGLKSSTSWALGLTVPIPISNRNQGGVARSRFNVQQTAIEVAAIERRAAAEVLNAERQYQLTRALLGKIESTLLPAMRQSRDDTLELFAKGELTAIEANNAQKDYNQAVRLYRDTLIRHRRTMLALNTAVGRRVLP